MINKDIWRGKRVFITGHTGFKGAWLSLWLHKLGAKVIGYALPPPTSPSLYKLCEIDKLVESITGDIRNFKKLLENLEAAKPEVVIHMAAQTLVRESYRFPLTTYETNVMGTINLLEAVRCSRGIHAVINVTTDKCYENLDLGRGYREDDPLGGYDPYSNSKACSELVTAAYRNSYFNPNSFQRHKVAIATARAGNVIGGGDWASDRLVSDFVNAILGDRKVVIRNPLATRPWQHVLEPLTGYLMLAEKLIQDGKSFASAWNFGPNDKASKTVEWVVQRLCQKWGGNAAYEIDPSEKHPHETGALKLDSAKAIAMLGWSPKWNLDKALDSIVEWTLAYRNDGDVKKICLKQIEEYEQSQGHYE